MTSTSSRTTRCCSACWPRSSPSWPRLIRPPRRSRPPRRNQLAKPQGNLILYCTPWCSTCRQARAYLAQNGIAYTEVDISKDRAAAAKVRGWANGNETTPTFDIQGTIIVDFDQARLRAALGMK